MELGLTEEATAWRDWLLRAVAGDPAQVQIMYGLHGERDLPERELGWLAGFGGARPVRVGNAAADQLQLDVFGETADMLAQARRGGIASHPQTGAVGRVALGRLEDLWREPDDGLWEVRGDQAHHVHSKVLAWVAFDRAARLIGSGAEARRWRRVANEVRKEVCARGFDGKLGGFTQSYGSSTVDASLLFIVLTGFLPPDDPRALGTVKAIEE